MMASSTSHEFNNGRVRGAVTVGGGLWATIFALAISVLSFSAAAQPTAPPAVPEVEPAGSAAPGALGNPTPTPTPTAAGGVDTPSASGPPVTVTTRILPDPSHVGDLLELQVIVAHPVGYSVNLPTGVRFAPLHLVGVEEGKVESTGQALRKTFTIRLQAFALDAVRVPSFALTYVDDGGGVHTVEVPSKTITVERLLANESEPQRRGEDPLVSLEYPAETAETVIYSLLLGALLAALATLAWLRHKARGHEVVEIPVEAPELRARRTLAALEGRIADLFEGDLHVLYYLELTEIAKHYLQGRFGIDALDRTTDEIRSELTRAQSKLGPLSAQEIIEFLSSSDLVKFARYAPSVEQGRADLDRIADMVERAEAARTAAAAGSDSVGTAPSSEVERSQASGERAASATEHPASEKSP